MKSLLKYDLFRSAGKTGSKAFFSRLLFNYPFRFIAFYRLSQEHSKKSLLGLFYRLLYRRYGVKYGIQIPLSVKIGKGLLLPHFGGIVVNSQSRIGDNCTLLHNVTIGNTKRGEKKGAPSIGNRVYIGPGAVIVGGIVVGDNVLIAPNSYVNLDVPSNSVVVGNPARVIARENATDGYVTNAVK
ncbi:serine acetyltransferase [Dyadobacter beijingensis]|uniref:Serine acetyltransferase n=1 Tax=Dyadobacter beijingensis TaxID=365489 RepID=A0ABQ2HMI2_9BACT|nr:serine O-acetyltransferase [Dyadobacter beijingensis]GGM86268.1 serine acetyltransferase [Dyadobacter beijingensis]